MSRRAVDGEARAAALPRDGPLAGNAVTIRVATPADLEIVAELRLSLVREHGGNLLYSRMRPDAPVLARRHFAAQLRSPDEVIFLAERDRRVIGILRCAQVRGSPLVFPALLAYISSVYVIPEARRRGVLRRLFEEAVHWCRARGLIEVRLHNAIDNEAANEAWSSLGFEPSEYLRVLHLE